MLKNNKQHRTDMRLKSFALGFAFAVAATASSSALDLGPGDAQYSGPHGGVPFILDYINTNFGIDLGSDGDELFKAESENDPADLSGPLSGSYTATFSNSATDPEDVLIEYTGGDAIDTSQPTYLLIKDGNANPGWYLFDLTVDGAGDGLDWNGTDDLDLDDFWPNQGAISHASLWGTSKEVPDGGTTLALLGTSLLGMIGFRKARTRKSA